MIYFNQFTQGVYDSVPFTTINLPDMDENIYTIHGIIDAMPKSLINVTYIAEDDRAIVNLIFNANNLSTEDLVQDLYHKVFPECGVDSYTKRVLGNHTYLTCEIPL